MNNIMFLIKLNDGKSSTVNGLNYEIKNYFIERNYITRDEDNYMHFQLDDKKFIVEHKPLNDTTKHIYNVFYDNAFNKRNFIKEIFFSQYVIDCITIFDTGSNKLLNNNYKELSQLENLLKYFLASRIADIQGDRVFDIINGFIVKAYIGEQYKKMITSLQRLELSELIKYINSNPLGGFEINILKSLSQINDEGENIFSQEEIDKIRLKIKDNVFKDVKSIIDEFGMIDNTCEWRNSIAHNSCVEDEIFLKMADDIKKLTEKINRLCVNIENINTKTTSLSCMPELATIVSTNKTKSNILLRIIELYNNFFENKLFNELVENKVDEKENTLFFEGSEIKIIIYDINPEFEFEAENDSELNTYKVLIYFDENKRELNLNSELYKLLDEISEHYIVIFDTISDMLCNKLYKDINHVENLVRLYIKVSEVILSQKSDSKIEKKKIEKNNLRLQMDLNALKINTDANKINLINNDLYELDFIKLLDKLNSPLIEKNYSKLMENEEYTNIDDFNRSIADLSSLDDNIESIGMKWRELYRIRTMVAHSFILSYDSFLEYKNLYLEASEEIENAIYRLFTENIRGYNLSFSKSSGDISLSIEYLVNKYILKLVKNDAVEISCYISNNIIWKAINNIFKMNLNSDSIFLTNNIIKDLTTVELDKLTVEELEFELEKLIKYYKLNLVNNSNIYMKLEKAISELLQEVANEYDEDNT